MAYRRGAVGLTNPSRGLSPEQYARRRECASVGCCSRNSMDRAATDAWTDCKFKSHRAHPRTRLRPRVQVHHSLSLASKGAALGVWFPLSPLRFPLILVILWVAARGNLRGGNDGWFLFDGDTRLVYVVS